MMRSGNPALKSKVFTGAGFADGSRTMTLQGRFGYGDWYTGQV